VELALSGYLKQSVVAQVFFVASVRRCPTASVVQKMNNLQGPSVAEISDPSPPLAVFYGKPKMMNLFLDPKIFNYAIMALYAANIVRWAFAGSIADVCYWTSALGITATVTFLYAH
jgi:hypothetical protein